MKKTLTQIGIILRRSFAIFWTLFSLFILLTILIIPPGPLSISQNNAESSHQDSAHPNITVADYRFFVWFDDDLYIVKSDAETSNLIKAQLVTYHGVEPKNLVPRLSSNGVTTSFTTPYFGYYAQIGSNINLASKSSSHLSNLMNLFSFSGEKLNIPTQTHFSSSM